MSGHYLNLTFIIKEQLTKDVNKKKNTVILVTFQNNKY